MRGEVGRLRRGRAVAVGVGHQRGDGVSRPFFSQKSHFFSQISRFFSQTHFEKIPVAGFFSNSSSRELECSRTFYVAFASTVPKNYDYRRLEATITRSASRSCHIFLKIYHFFLKILCFGRHLTYSTWEVPEFSQNNEFFSK